MVEELTMTADQFKAAIRQIREQLAIELAQAISKNAPDGNKNRFEPHEPLETIRGKTDAHNFATYSTITAPSHIKFIEYGTVGPIKPKNGQYLKFQGKDGKWLSVKEVRGQPPQFLVRSTCRTEIPRIAPRIILNALRAHAQK
jgi:hypothetical protein